MTTLEQLVSLKKAIETVKQHVPLNYNELTADDLLDELNYLVGSSEKDLIIAAITRIDEIKGLLIGLIKEIAKTKGASYFDKWEGGKILFLAPALLAHCRIYESFEDVVSLLNLPEEVWDDMAGEVLVESFNSLLATLCRGRFDPLLKIVWNPKNSKLTRLAAFEAMIIYARQTDHDRRPEVITAVQHLLDHVQQEDEPEDLLLFIPTLVEFGIPFSMMQKIHSLYSSHVFPPDSTVYSKEEFDKDCMVINPKTTTQDSDLPNAEPYPFDIFKFLDDFEYFSESLNWTLIQNSIDDEIKKLKKSKSKRKQQKKARKKGKNKNKKKKH